MNAPNQANKKEESESRLHCSAEWHLAKLKTGVAGIIYSHSMKISSKSENYFCSIPQMAEYLEKDDRTIGNAFNELEAAGFFQRVREEPGKAVNYRPVRHKEWAERHPDKCIKKSEIPRSAERDPLGKTLTAACGQEINSFFFPHVLSGLRKTKFTDEQIVAEFRVFLDQESETEIRAKYGWKNSGTARRFKEYLQMKWVYYQQQPVAVSE
jgi:hypothetical protein